MPKSIKKILLISFIIMLALPFLVLSAALPFKQTQYLLLRAVNRKKDVQTKIINYKNFIKKYPFYIPPRLKLAEYHTVLLRPGPEETKHILSAIDQYNATLEIDPANKDALTGLKDIYLWEKRYDKAESICNRLIDLYPEEATSRLTLASIYLSKNMIDEALEETKTAISYDPENGDAYMLAGSIYERKRNLTETLAAYKHAAKYSRKDKKRNTELNARYRLGRLYLRTGLLFDAMQQFERINEIGATSVNFQLELATTYFRLGLHDKLLATLTAAPLNPASWELSPLHKKSIPKTYRAYTHFLFGQVYVAKKDYPRALKYFKDANRLGIKFKAGFFYYLEKLIKAPWGNIEQRYKVGDHTIGTVTDITSYGALIELEEGVKGFVRSSDLSWTEEIIFPGEILKKDEEIEAVILDINEKDRKIALGIKQLLPDPWEGVTERYKVGQHIKVTVTNLDYQGVLAELEEGIKGFIHPSDLSWTEEIIYPGEILKKDEEIEAVILDIDEKNRKIVLGIKQLMPDPWGDIVKRYKPGTITEGKIINVSDFAITVELEENLKGSLSVTGIGIPPSQRIENLFKVGDIIDVTVKGINNIDRRLILSLEESAKKAILETVTNNKETNQD